MFSEFQNGLYTSTTKTHENEHEQEDKYEQHQHTMKPFTMQEFSDAIKPTQKRQSCGHERSQRSDDKAQTHTYLQLYTKANKLPQATAPKRAKQSYTHEWDPSSPLNYRPICSISIVYKVFSQLLFMQLQPKPDANQSADQAAFRLGCSATGDLFTFRQLRPRAAEWHQPLWVPAIDSKKFAKVENSLRMEGLTGARHRGTIHAVTHVAPRPTVSNGTHGGQKQTHPPRAENQAGRPTLHALVQLTPTVSAS